MPFIGNQPTQGRFIELDSLTASATDDYTLQLNGANFSPESVNNLLVSINGVIQGSSTMSLNGAVLTVGATLSCSDTIDFVRVFGNVGTVSTPTDGSVTANKIGTGAVDLTSKVSGVLPVANGGTGATSFAEANSVIETWYYNDDNTTEHNNTDLLFAGYSRLTTNNTANKNGGMSHATSAGTNGTGIWTFPSTGIWRIELVLNFYHSGGASGASGVRMEVTTDNNTYNEVTGIRDNGYATNANVGITLPYTLNVNNVSNVKFRHKLSLNNTVIVRGGTSDPYGTKIHFIKLCPSV